MGRSITGFFANQKGGDVIGYVGWISAIHKLRIAGTFARNPPNGGGLRAHVFVVGN